MKTVKELREAIKNKTLTEFQLQDAVKYFAENIEKMPLGAEMGFKEYLRRGADLLSISTRDLQDVYNSFRK